MSRPPLSILNNSPNTCATSHPRESPIDSSIASSRKRVTFEVDGPVTSSGFANALALLLADKHETRPSTLKMTRFSETLDLLKSASAWDKFSLKRFGVKFEKTTYTELNTLIKNQRWYDPETETTTQDFVERYHDIVKASLNVTEDELQRLRSDVSLERKLYKCPLRDFMLSLVNMLETDSEESQSLTKDKGTISPAVIYSPMSTTSQAAEDPGAPSTQFGYPRVYDTPTNKRKVSETSFGTRSTETTPAKLVHPEAKVQSLQNKFVDSIINNLWLGKIDIPWARGRHMFLTYSEFLSCNSLLTIRTNSTSFQYTLRRNVNEVVIGRVKAIADGALRLKTNKVKDENKYGIWSKQRCALSFEAKKLNTDWIAILKDSGDDPGEALAEARAAQILSEMLGMVCHPEYFQNPPRDQMGIIVHFDGFYASVYFANFPSEYLSTVRDIDINVLKNREDKIELKHTRRYNLFKTSERTEFIREFVALLRFIAAGEANIGHLHKDNPIIHRNKCDSDSVMTVLHPPQEVMEEGESGRWSELNAWQYTE